MVLTIPISPEVEAKLKAKAAVAGVDVQTFAARALERTVCGPSLDELLEPVHEEFTASGMSEDQLVELLEAAKHEQRALRRGCEAS